jgi:hypothetical protein
MFQAADIDVLFMLNLNTLSAVCYISIIKILSSLNTTIYFDAVKKISIKQIGRCRKEAVMSPLLIGADDDDGSCSDVFSI